MRPESEKRLEATLTKEVTKMGGMCIKLTSQFHRGLPDRLILMPGDSVYFAEIKSTGEQPTPLQAATHTRLRDMGYFVAVVDDSEDLRDLLDLLRIDALER